VEKPVIDTTVAHSARVHDYWLGGKDNFAADRAAGDAVMAAYPGIVTSVRANRAFLARVVRFLTRGVLIFERQVISGRSGHAARPSRSMVSSS
jgi:hypothetical protein